MSKSYVHLHSAILSILVKAKLAERARLAESDCQIETPRNLDLDIPDADYCGCSLNMIEALEDIVEKNKKGEIHNNYQSDIKNIESFLEKLKSDENHIQTINDAAIVVRERVIAEIVSKRDKEVAELTNNQKMLSVKVKTGKLSEEQVKAIQNIFANKGFKDGLVRETNWSRFIGLSEGSADDLYNEVVNAVPNTTKNFISKKVEVSEVNIVDYLNQEVISKIY